MNNWDGTFTLAFLGTPQARYCVVASPDLTLPMPDWPAIAGSTNTVTKTSGWWRFTVTNTAAQQFCRSAAINPCQ